VLVVGSLLETSLGVVTALVGLLGAIAGLLQIIKGMRTKPAPMIMNPGDLDDHLIDELVKARVELILMQRDYSHARSTT